ncbi:MAG: class I SAM-dependent methyltransferase [Phycisphaerales bacterium]|nr:class I SAM-dependent methyltransferase [Planctomycetota bacterium]MCH8507351.1 class I SAM-dependent methyltransferase [Phycisphaerales bacterium]
MPITRSETKPQAKHARHDLEIAIPVTRDHFDQDEEWVVVHHENEWRKVRLHDYAEVYSIPGLYDRWVYDIFRCRSPQKVGGLLDQALKRESIDPASIRVLDLGAGNGYVAKVLSEYGIRSFTGVDIHQEAAAAAERDRPGLYQNYIVGDMTNLHERGRKVLDLVRPNCLTCVAALGFGDIPPEVFAAAFNSIEPDGWAAFTIKTDFLDPKDRSGFSVLIRRMIDQGVLEVAERESYVHRVATDGEELVYTALIGRKRGQTEPSWVV